MVAAPPTVYYQDFSFNGGGGAERRTNSLPCHSVTFHCTNSL